MREVDSDALRLVAQALGIGNPVTAVDQVAFDDGVLQQVLDVAPLIRRGGTVGTSSGIFAGRVVNVHPVGDTDSTTIDPYAIAAPRAGWPSPIPHGLDVWLLHAQAAAVVGETSATIIQRLEIVHPATGVAFGTTGTSTQLAYAFMGELPISGTLAYLKLADGGPVSRPWRLPRGAVLTWSTKSSGVGTNITLQVVLGLFPAGLGHDGCS